MCSSSLSPWFAFLDHHLTTGGIEPTCKSETVEPSTNLYLDLVFGGRTPTAVGMLLKVSAAFLSKVTIIIHRNGARSFEFVFSTRCGCCLVKIINGTLVTDPSPRMPNPGPLHLFSSFSPCFKCRRGCANKVRAPRPFDNTFVCALRLGVVIPKADQPELVVRQLT